MVTTYHPGKSQYSTALRVTNQSKNRSPDYLASDSSRVFLSPIVDTEGEDYINASWISGKPLIMHKLKYKLYRYTTTHLYDTLFLDMLSINRKLTKKDKFVKSKNHKLYNKLANCEHSF